MMSSVPRILSTALLTLGVVSSSGPAAALDFSWSFFDEDGTVEGVVLGLTDGASGQAATSLLITDNGGTSVSINQELIGSATSNSWTIAGGAVTAVAFSAEDWDLPLQDSLDLTNFEGVLRDGVSGDIRAGTVVFTPLLVPEPHTGALIALGLGGVGFAGRRRAG